MVIVSSTALQDIPTRILARNQCQMFGAISRSNRRIVPLAIGGAAIACSAYYAARMFTPVRNESSAVFVGDDKWIALPLSKVEDLSHDTKRFTFDLPGEDSTTGLTLCSALLAKFVTAKGNNVIRPYTPVSDLSRKGSFQLVIKHYKDGKMTSHLFGLKPSDTVLFKGPIKKWQWKENSFDSIVLLGAGTGINPLFQLVHHLSENPNEKTEIHLFYGNKTPQDILLKKELDELQKKHPDRLKISYFVDKKDGEFEGETGFITKEYLEKHAPKPSEKTHVFVCGPPPFMKAYSGEKVSPMDQGELVGILKDLGYSKDQVFKF
ncbi:hypothetical protein HG536_0E03820 [Torulaspora globosa]|uniref:NADH-cytochrome b5 reductase n=1 Tax=Torulaspora globosa TaxID=48254 RepID=A0A7G3ZIY5_9SACH|nr:uncharacterized protein HG536_0E03820 [Torulaspora globosa]QLL33471.1 hypothetical protein HG536_0E03820 [Torulaspora globosa]